MCGLSSRWGSQTPNFSNRNILLVCMTNELAKMVSHIRILHIYFVCNFNINYIEFIPSKQHVWGTILCLSNVQGCIKCVCVYIAVKCSKWINYAVAQKTKAVYTDHHKFRAVQWCKKSMHSNIIYRLTKYSQHIFLGNYYFY